MVKRKGDSKEKHIQHQNAQDVTEEKTVVVEQMKKGLEEMEDKWLRAAAELENYKKRWAKEKQELIIYVRVEFIKEILPLLDHFENAMQLLPEEKDDFEKGIEIIFKEINNILARYGLVKIDNLAGEVFNPFEQEAIGYEENKEFPEGVVIDVLRAGYRLGEKLLRPASVKVSKGEKGEKDETENNTQDIVNSE